MASNPAQALAAQLISQTLATINLLESLSVISSQDAATIRSKLPSPSATFPSLDAPAQLSHSFSSLNLNHPPQYLQSPGGPPPPPLPTRSAPESRAKALWDYNGTEQDDLVFRAGDVVIIDEEVNQQWYRGRVIPSGQAYPLERSGLFPSNYVEKMPNQYSSTAPAMVPYQPPQPPQQYQPPQSQQYPPPQPPQQYYDQKPPMPMYQPPPPQQAQVIEEPKKGRFGKYGNQFGVAAVTGAGFGAGSALASDLVNKIF